MIINKTRKIRAVLYLVTASFIAAQACFLVFPGIFEPWNDQVVDQFFLFRTGQPRLEPAYDNTVVHVDLNNTTIRQLNDFYLNRSHYARVIANLAQMGAAAQAVDVVFAARSGEADDSLLIEATRRAGNVYFGLAFALSGEDASRKDASRSDDVQQYLDLTRWNVKVEGSIADFYTGLYPLITFPALAGASKGLGFLSIRPDRDGVIRRLPLLVSYNGGFYPSLPFRVVCDYLGVTPENIRVIAGKAIVLEGASRPGGTIHDISIPIDRKGNMIINFIGPWERMKHYNFGDIYRASEDREELEIWKEELQGKIVLISDVSTGATDIGPVPTDLNYPLAGLHASVIHTILTKQFIRKISGPEMLAIELCLLLAVTVLAWRRSSVYFTVGMVGLSLAYLLAAAAFFFWGRTVVHVLRPLFFFSLATVLVNVWRYLMESREKAVLRRSFEAYFPPAVVEKIVAEPEYISARGERKELTILFSDIRNFTSFSSTLDPDHIRRLLNEYFDAMVEIVFRFGGTVDKYIGDGLMVFFGDPEPQADHATRAVRAAIDMQKTTRLLGERWEREGGFAFQVRIGINTGEVVVGNMGSRRRLSYTVLGAPVNLAQRLESNAPPGGILISQRTCDLLENQVSTRPMGQLKVKGLETPVTVHTVSIDQ